MPKAKKKQDASELPEGELSTEMLLEILGEGKASLGKPVAARDYISTQCASLNYALGRPGIPCGGITNIYGPEASGKSTLTYHLIAETQASGGVAALYDSEGAYDYERGKRIGIDYDKLVMLEPSNLEDLFEQISTIITTVSQKRPDAKMLLAIDSVAGSATKAQLEAAYGDRLPASQAFVVSQAMPKLVPEIAKTKTALVLVGQTRANIEFSPVPGQQKETQTAEGAIRFYSHVRIRTQHAGEVGEKGEPSGMYTLAFIKKNKTAPPFRTARYAMKFWDGIDKAAAKLDVAQKIGMVQLRGGWYSYGETRFRSSDFQEVLDANPALEDAINVAPMHWLEEA